MFLGCVEGIEKGLVFVGVGKEGFWAWLSRVWIVFVCAWFIEGFFSSF